MNVELFMYLKQYLLGMFKVSHLDEEPTRHEKWTQRNDPFHFFVFFCPKILRIFLNICCQHCFYSLNYSLAFAGSRRSILIDYIILDFVLVFIDLCWIKQESSRCHAVCFSLKWRLKWPTYNCLENVSPVTLPVKRSRFSYGELLKQRRFFMFFL